MKNASRIFKGPLIWILLCIGLIIVFLQFAGSGNGYKDIPTSEAVSIINSSKKLDSVTLTDGDQVIKITENENKKYRSYWVGNQSDQLVDRLNDRVKAKTLKSWQGENPGQSIWKALLINFLPFVIILLFFLWVMNAAQGMGGRGGVMGFGKSKAKVGSKDTPKSTFADVAGCQEAIDELQEIREFLAEPAKFQRVGAKIPKGVLLYGPPGTGKTLLARAVAGEAGVPFFSISGSDFVEMFVGVGASRVRDLFEQAKEAAPAIIFIDEIDAVGRHRGAGMGGGHDEREQTLNQLLVEMDGFDVHGGVILIAATNRPDVLDPALLRPGRFDRQIAVEAPDLDGRLKILKVHAHGKPMADDVDLASIARRTPGMTGADLANVLNEAALLTARANLPVIGNSELDEAIDRVIAGPQKKTRLMNEHERLVTAYHEGGHALVAAAMPGSDPVHKVTILPRGRALGYTMVVPEDDKYSVTRNELLDQLAYAMGGRVAEEIVFKDPSTGAANDIQKATDTARKMVTEYGMSAKVGAVKLGGGSSEPFVGGAPGGSSREYSEELAYLVDAEVRTLLDQAHAEAHWVLTENRDVLDRLAYELLEKETLTQEAIAAIFADVRKRPERGVWLASDDRLPQDIPPVLSPSERRSRHDGGEQTPVGVEGTTVPVRPEGAPPSSLGGDAAGPGLPPHGGPSNTPGPGEGPTF